MIISNFIKRVVYKEKSSSKTYISYLRSKGIRIGEQVTIFEPRNTFIDDTRPCLLGIGNNVKISRGVTILTHDYSWSVINGKNGDILGAAGKVIIGNNVFIGMQATILMGVEIGNNVIIGANSLVTKDIPDDCVVAGNPARIICSLSDYIEKRKAVQVKEAMELAAEWSAIHEGERPPKAVFREFLWLFDNEENLDGTLIESTFEEILHINGNDAMTHDAYKNRKPIFASYEEFLKECNL